MCCVCRISEVTLFAMSKTCFYMTITFRVFQSCLNMGKRKFMVPLHFDHEEIQPESPTAGADLDLVIQVSSNFYSLKLLPMPLKQDGSQPVVIPVDRCILLPACPLLEKLCSTLPDYVDCACFRQRVGLIVSYFNASTFTMLSCR